LQLLIKIANFGLHEKRFLLLQGKTKTQNYSQVQKSTVFILMYYSKVDELMFGKFTFSL